MLITKLRLISLTITLTIIASLPLQANQIEQPINNQKQAIDTMHHKLHDDQAPFKAQEISFLKDLNEMTVKEDVKLEDINNKIDQLMAAKNQIMRLRYQHLVEMRAVLTEKQKVSYDKGVLSRSAIK